MLQVLEAAIAILIILGTLHFVSFHKAYSLNINIDELRNIVYSDPLKLCNNFTYVKIINFTDNKEYSFCSEKYSVIFSYLFAGNNTTYKPILVVLGR